MVPWSFNGEALGCFVAKNDSELVVFLGDHLLPGAFFRFGGVEGQLGGNGGLLDMDVIGRMLPWRGKIAGVGSYSSLELAFSPVDDRVVCCKEGHPKEHGISSETYDEEWVHIGFPLVMNLEVQWVKKLSQCLAISERVVCNKSNKLQKNVKIMYVII